MEYIERSLSEAEFLRGSMPDVVVATGGNAEAIASLCPFATDDGNGIEQGNGWVVGAARGQGAQWLWLEVRAGNAPARALYTRYGFQ